MVKKSTLIISHLSASTQAGVEILHDVSLSFASSKVYAIMGPNGSGKSTLAHVCMGNPEYKIQGQLLLNHKNIEKLLPEERARCGLFLSYQAPVAIAGVSVVNLLRTAYHITHKAMPIGKFMTMIGAYAKELHIEPALLERSIHDGFSGGEKKKIELLQALVLKPVFAIFDEIDTGLDVDALKVVAYGINTLKKAGTGVIMITHYKRLLSYVPVDIVYVLSKGKVIKTGDRKLVGLIERKGYTGL
jgi:Fe-S cluster assembly ATP-binding protein